MDKINPEISVFTSMPNNGYCAIVFTDFGMMLSANCDKKDAYKGLLEACAHFLLDFIKDKRPDITSLTGSELNPDETRQIDDYADSIGSVYNTFCKDLKSKLIVGSTTQQLEAAGLPHSFARILAAGMEVFPEKFEKVSPDAGCDEDEVDDSDDEYNLD